MEVAGPLGTPLGLAQRKRASPRINAPSNYVQRTRQEITTQAMLGQRPEFDTYGIFPNKFSYSPPPHKNYFSHTESLLGIALITCSVSFIDIENVLSFILAAECSAS